MHQVPTLEVKDLATGQTVSLTQSLAIIDFLEEAFPQTPSLLPQGADALMRANVRRIAEIINSGTAWKEKANGTIHSMDLLVLPCDIACATIGIQPLQNLSAMSKITTESSGAYDGRAFGRDAIIK